MGRILFLLPENAPQDNPRPPSRDIAWAAGIWEGEGTAGMSSQFKQADGGAVKEYNYAQFSIGNTDIILLKKFLAIFGIGRIYQVTEAEGNHAAAYTYVVSNKDIDKLAIPIDQFVVSEYKRQQLRKIGISGAPSAAPTFEERLSWLAGIFEGEGNARWAFDKQPRGKPKLVNGVYKRGFWRETVSITNCQRDMLDAIRSLVGFGRVGLHSIGHHRAHDAYSYKVSTRSARKFARLILPFIRTERKMDQLLDILNPEGKKSFYA